MKFIKIIKSQLSEDYQDLLNFLTNKPYKNNWKLTSLNAQDCDMQVYIEEDKEAEDFEYIPEGKIYNVQLWCDYDVSTYDEEVYLKSVGVESIDRIHIPNTPEITNERVILHTEQSLLNDFDFDKYERDQREAWEDDQYHYWKENH